MVLSVIFQTRVSWQWQWLATLSSSSLFLSLPVQQTSSQMKRRLQGESQSTRYFSWQTGSAKLWAFPEGPGGKGEWRSVPVWDVSGVCVLSHVQLSETPWTGVHRALLSMEFSRQEILEWVAVSYSRESSRPRGWTHISCISRQILYHWAAWEALEGGLQIQMFCSLPSLKGAPAFTDWEGGEGGRKSGKEGERESA